MTSYPATITRRSGRHSKQHRVLLAKPARDYRQSEEFEVEIDGRPMTVNVEIPISETNATLYVA